MSLNNPSHFGKINWLPSKGRAEYYIVVFGFKSSGMELCLDILMKCLSLDCADTGQDCR